MLFSGFDCTVQPAQCIRKTAQLVDELFLHGAAAVQQAAAQAATIQRFFIVFGSDYILYSKVIKIRDNHAAFSRFFFSFVTIGAF